MSRPAGKTTAVVAAVMLPLLLLVARPRLRPGVSTVTHGYSGVHLMAGDHYEPNRFLGLPRRPDAQARQGEEPQRVMGFPVDWFGRADLDWFRSMAHPVRTYRRWARRRRLGPYAVDEDEPGR